MRTPDSSTPACMKLVERAPNGIRTRAAALKGRCPRPLDDGGLPSCSRPERGSRQSIAGPTSGPSWSELGSVARWIGMGSTGGSEAYFAAWVSNRARRCSRAVHARTRRIRVGPFAEPWERAGRDRSAVDERHPGRRASTPTRSWQPRRDTGIAHWNVKARSPGDPNAQRVGRHPAHHVRARRPVPRSSRVARSAGSCPTAEPVAHPDVRTDVGTPAPVAPVDRPVPVVRAPGRRGSRASDASRNTTVIG